MFPATQEYLIVSLNVMHDELFHNGISGSSNLNVQETSRVQDPSQLGEWSSQNAWLVTVTVNNL